MDFLSAKAAVDLVVRRDLLVMLVSLVLLVDPDPLEARDLKDLLALLVPLEKKDLRLVM